METNLFHDIVFLDVTKNLFITFFVNFFLNGRIVLIKQLSVVAAVTLIYWYLLLTLRKKYPLKVND